MAVTGMTAENGLAIPADAISRQPDNSGRRGGPHRNANAVVEDPVRVDDVADAGETQPEGVLCERVERDVVAISPVDLQAVRVAFETVSTTVLSFPRRISMPCEGSGLAAVDRKTLLATRLNAAPRVSSRPSPLSRNSFRSTLLWMVVVLVGLPRPSSPVNMTPAPPSSRASRRTASKFLPSFAGGAGLLGACSDFSDTLLAIELEGDERIRDRKAAANRRTS